MSCKIGLETHDTTITKQGDKLHHVSEGSNEGRAEFYLILAAIVCNCRVNVLWMTEQLRTDHIQ